MSTTSLATSTTSISATVTALLALTTPFVQRPECSSIWDLTSGSTYDDGTSELVTILASDAADARFASCQPSGWEDVVTKSRFSFSPAVCPSDWTYYDMASTVSIGTDGRVVATFSTAYCCASGHSLRTGLTDFPIETMTALCARTVANGDASIVGTLSHGAGSTRLFTGGIQAHDAWHISWAASDTSTLSPSLPALTNSMLVPTWVPGETIPPGKYDRGSGESGSQNDGPGLGGVIWFLMIGIPIIGVAVIGLCVWCCIRHRRSKRRERLRQQEISAEPLSG